MKVAVNRSYGGFELSDAAYERLIELGMKAAPYTEEGNLPEGAEISISDPPRFPRFGEKYYKYWEKEERTNALLIRVIEELGEAANGWGAELEVVEISDSIQWTIKEHDGKEWVAETY